jgi:2-polyprenyl-3-methyl-5-hydroxy-6-metoxy-1,4-benzoquinol methylase
MRSICPRCKFDQASVRYDFGGDSIVRCVRCELLYLHPWPAPEQTLAVYSEDYFQNESFLEGDHSTLFGYTDYVSERFNKQPQFARIAREVRALLPQLSGEPELLEIGCGFGYFLDQAFEEGFSVSGLEFNPSAVERLRRKFAFPILSGALESVRLDPGSLDVVAMFDVIEHLRDPFGGLDRIHEALKPGGLLVLSTPDAESWVSRLIGHRLEDFRRTREHLFFFGRDTLRDVLDEHGFEVISARSIGHTFEIAFLLERLALYNRPIFHGLRRLVEALGLGRLQVHVNPLTKMLVVARRRGSSSSFSSSLQASAAPSASAVDRAVTDELRVLEQMSQRHYRWIFDVIQPFLGQSILEVGSGIGVISKFLISRCRSLTLTDYQPFYLDILRDRFGELPHVRREILDLDHPPFRVEEEVDSVVCLNVLEHIEDDEAALAGLAELLPPGGRLVLQVPNHPGLYGSLDETYGHVRRYSSRQLRARLERAGFRVVFERCFNPFSIPGWIVAGKLLRSSRLNPASLRGYDALVPVLRRLDFLSRLTGLSLIVCAERREATPPTASPLGRGGIPSGPGSRT